LIRKELGGTAVTIATGGLAPLITKHTEMIDYYEPDLILNGLQILFEMNR